MTIEQYIEERIASYESMREERPDGKLAIDSVVYELQAVLSKIQELQKEERIQNLEQLIKMAKEDNQDTSYMEGMLKGYKDLLEFSS